MHYSKNNTEKKKIAYLIASLATGVFLGPLNSTMLVVGLRHIADFYSVSFSEVTWLIIVYLIVMAAVHPLSGKLGDIYGRKQFFIGGLYLTMLGAVLVLTAPNFYFIIAARILQALGVSCIIPNAMAIIQNDVPAGGRRNSAFGIIGFVLAAGAAVGPPIGGLLIDFWGWQLIFLINLPICLPLVFFAGKYISPKTPGGKTRLDIPGAVSFSALLTAVALLLSMPGMLGTSTIILLLGLFFLATLFFVWWEGRIDYPIFHFSMLRQKTLILANVLAFMMNFILYNMLVVIPVYLDQAWGLRPSLIGLALTSVFGVLGLSQPVSGYLATRFGKKIPIIMGSLTLALGILGLTFVGSELRFWYQILMLSICGLGLGLGNVAIQTAALDSMPSHMAGLVSGLYSLSRHMGSFIAASILGIIVNNLSGMQVYFQILFVFCLVSAVVGLMIESEPKSRMLKYDD